MAQVSRRKHRQGVREFVQLNGRVDPDNKKWLADVAAQRGVSRDAVLDELLTRARAMQDESDPLQLRLLAG